MTFFLEMKINNRGYRRINIYSEGWKDIHETAEHGLAICCKKESVRILKDFYLSVVIEPSPVPMKRRGEKILLVLVYSPPRQQVRTFIDGMIRIFRDI